MEGNGPGWYSCLVIPNGRPRTQWITIDDFWLCSFNQRRDRSPALAFHLSAATISDALSDTGQLHSIKLTPGHPCNYDSVCLFTPNQFDIADIKKAIHSEQQKWEELLNSADPELPQNFTVDLSGKFIFRQADRLTICVQRTSITIRQLNHKDLVLPIDGRFDLHPTLEGGQDVRWIYVHFWSDSVAQSLRLHCSDVADMMKLVTLLLHCKGRLLAKGG
jgi:hypothetical protein